MLLIICPIFQLFCYLLLDFHVKTGMRFSLRDKRLFEINEVKITRVDCTINFAWLFKRVKKYGTSKHNRKQSGYFTKGDHSACNDNAKTIRQRVCISTVGHLYMLKNVRI